MLQGKQRLRTRAEPEAAKRLLALVNGIPGTAKYEDLKNEDVFDQLEALGVKGLYIALSNAMAQWHEEARTFVLGNMVEGAASGLDRFHEALTFSEIVQSIAKENNRFWEEHSVKEGGLPRYREFKLRSFANATEIIRLDTKTKRAERIDSGLLKDLVDNVEIDRIKSCAYSKCSKVFWAGRVDKPCCSDACWNPFKQQRHRDKQHRNEQTKKLLQMKRRGIRSRDQSK